MRKLKIICEKKVSHMNWTKEIRYTIFFSELKYLQERQKSIFYYNVNN